MENYILKDVQKLINNNDCTYLVVEYEVHHKKSVSSISFDCNIKKKN